MCFLMNHRNIHSSLSLWNKLYPNTYVWCHELNSKCKNEGLRSAQRPLFQHSTNRIHIQATAHYHKYPKGKVNFTFTVLERLAFLLLIHFLMQHTRRQGQNGTKTHGTCSDLFSILQLYLFNVLMFARFGFRESGKGGKLWPGTWLFPGDSTSLDQFSK